MAGLSPLEAHDLVRFAEVFEERLAAANEAQTKRRYLEREKRWLNEALELIRESRLGAAELLEKARDLPELAEVREEFAEDLQQVWVDSLERLHAGITFHAGSRSPLIETLFPHLKFPNLRKASRQAIEQYSADFERRANLAYVVRMLSQDTFTFAPPVMEQVRSSYAKWQSCFSSEAVGTGDPEVREALLSLGKATDLAVRQARMLAEAALTPVRGAYDESNLAAKPRRRTPKAVSVVATESAETSDSVESAPLDQEVAPDAGEEEQLVEVPSESAAEEAPPAEAPAPTEDAAEVAPKKRTRKVKKAEPATTEK